jgi:bifunctional non-homologous end joining protein LigD
VQELIPRRRALRSAAFVEPCIPTFADRPPAGPGWSHKIKHDGYRLQIARRRARDRVFLRRRQSG